ncbi:MAG: hypothetical protein ABSC15_03895 [Terriglobales bacterium]
MSAAHAICPHTAGHGAAISAGSADTASSIFTGAISTGTVVTGTITCIPATVATGIITCIPATVATADAIVEGLNFWLNASATVKRLKPLGSWDSRSKSDHQVADLEGSHMALLRLDRLFDDSMRYVGLKKLGPVLQ